MQMKPRDFLMVFLAKLEEFVPPPEKCHHVICYAKYGHDSVGWEPKLAVMVNTKGKFVTFFLEDEDFEKDPETLAGDIAKDLGKDDPNTQYAVVAGQFKESST